MRVLSEASDFLLSEFPRLAHSCAGRPLLDLACGRGRQAIPAARSGLRVVAIDRNPISLRELQDRCAAERLPLSSVRADLETEHGIPVVPGGFGGILVFRFLYRPLASAIVEALAEDGLLLYETFTVHSMEVDYGPRNEAFLLQPGELPELFSELDILSHWEGWTDDEKPLAVARLVARRRAS